jgi:hypothetical protein
MKYDGDLFEHHDEVLYFQISTAQKLPAVMGLTADEFLMLDEKYNFISLLRVGYELFHLTGIKGIALAFQRLMRGEDIFPR